MYFPDVIGLYFALAKDISGCASRSRLGSGLGVKPGLEP